MKQSVFLTAFLASTALALSAAQADSFKVKIEGLKDGDRIPAEWAVCAPDGHGKTMDGGNLNPAIDWSGAPKDTKSFALIMHDPDVPTKFDDANKDGKTISAKLPRRDFYHWVVVDIPATAKNIELSQDSGGGVGPKKTGKFGYGLRGKNDFGTGDHGGYDGPCPPWNDEIMHHYHFTVYALDVASVKLPEDGNFGGKEAMKAIAGHVLAKSSVMGTYTQNAKLLQAK